jgi:ectoine hydroxylase-related dioxygenase (phytanoyl-CoA dioxygenase family)
MLFKEANMARQSIEDLLEKGVSVLKEKVELKQKELEEMQDDFKKYERALSAFHGKAAKKRARVKK